MQMLSACSALKNVLFSVVRTLTQSSRDTVQQNASDRPRRSRKTEGLGFLDTTTFYLKANRDYVKNCISENLD